MVKADLTHLVGRPLVPFYTADGAENVEHVADGAEDERQWHVSDDGRGVQVRRFVDGYFVDVGVIGQADSAARGSPHTAPPAAKGKKAKDKAKAVAMPGTPTSQPRQPPPSALYPAPATPQSSSAAPSPSARFAAPAFANSPSPMKVPLPRFLKDKGTAKAAAPVNVNGALPATIQEENAAYVRGPSLMHLLQQPEEEEAAPAPALAPVDHAPISLMHLLPHLAVDAAPAASSSPAVTAWPSSTGVAAFPSYPLPSSSSPSSLSSETASDPVVSAPIPQLLFLRQSSVDADHTVVTQVPLLPSPWLATSHLNPSVPPSLLPPASFTSSTSSPSSSSLPLFTPPPSS